MPTFEMPYGRSSVWIDLPDALRPDVLEAGSAPSMPLDRAFDAAWKQPIGLDDPASLFRPGDRLLVLINDHTRPTPTRQLLGHLWERISVTVSPEDVTVLVATGTHRPPAEDELAAMLGELRHAFRVSIHDCDRDVIDLGTMRGGSSLWVNRALVEADRIVSIGHIGAHYYAGYSGGRKNVLPGVAGRTTIETNHARMIEPESVACIYDGNPVNEEMVDAARRVGLDLIIDVVLASNGTVAKVVIGAPEPAHAVGRAFWDSHFHVPIEARYDVVIASAGGHPKDINLYQAYKAQYNAMRALRDGGILYLIAACPDGIGHSVFTEWIERSASPGDVLAIYEHEGFRLGGHKAVYLARDLQRATLYLCAELDDDTVRRFYLEPAQDVAPVLDAARAQFGERFRALVLPHAADTFPVRRKA